MHKMANKLPVVEYSCLLLPSLSLSSSFSLSLAFPLFLSPHLTWYTRARDIFFFPYLLLCRVGRVYTRIHRLSRAFLLSEPILYPIPAKTIAQDKCILSTPLTIPTIFDSWHFHRRILRFLSERLQTGEGGKKGSEEKCIHYNFMKGRRSFYLEKLYKRIGLSKDPES